MIIGIIAEDNSDVECAKALIYRITNNKKVGIKRMAKNGCSILTRKCSSWAKNLHHRGCTLLIVIHDSDGNNPTDIHKKLKTSLLSCPIGNNLISIPVQEIESWLLADPNAIKVGMNLKKEPKIQYETENISSPKEFLGALIDKTSNHERIYNHPTHNKIIAENISIEILKNKCPSFLPFFQFIKDNVRTY